MDIFLLVCLIMSALWTVMTRSLIRCAIGLALTSCVLTIYMFRLQAPLAAVFELSVCAGLISVLFIATISLTEPLTLEEKSQLKKEKFLRYWYLPVILVGVGVVLSFVHVGHGPFLMPVPEVVKDVRSVLWNVRQLDLWGQIIILLAGVFGVVILLKERNKNAK
jgi:NADH-quinone oxidoreductase subunit J